MIEWHESDKPAAQEKKEMYTRSRTTESSQTRDRIKKLVGDYFETAPADLSFVAFETTAAAKAFLKEKPNYRKALQARFRTDLERQRAANRLEAANAPFEACHAKGWGGGIAVWVAMKQCFSKHDGVNPGQLVRETLRLHAQEGQRRNPAPVIQAEIQAEIQAGAY